MGRSRHARIEAVQRFQESPLPVAVIDEPGNPALGERQPDLAGRFAADASAEGLLRHRSHVPDARGGDEADAIAGRPDADALQIQFPTDAVPQVQGNASSAHTAHLREETAGIEIRAFKAFDSGKRQGGWDVHSGGCRRECAGKVAGGVAGETGATRRTECIWERWENRERQLPELPGPVYTRLTDNENTVRPGLTELPQFAKGLASTLFMLPPQRFTTVPTQKPGTAWPDTPVPYPIYGLPAI